MTTYIDKYSVTRLRIFKEDGAWYLDGRDDRGNYTLWCWGYEAWEDAVRELDRVAQIFPNLGKTN